VQAADLRLAEEMGRELGAALERILVASMEIGAMAIVRNTGSPILDALGEEDSVLNSRYEAVRDTASAATTGAAIDRSAVLASNDADSLAAAARTAVQTAERMCAGRTPQDRANTASAADVGEADAARAEIAAPARIDGSSSSAGTSRTKVRESG